MELGNLSDIQEAFFCDYLGILLIHKLDLIKIQLEQQITSFTRNSHQIPVSSDGLISFQQFLMSYL
jgi:hypothetical protein